jgi:hypothetical protein
MGTHQRGSARDRLVHRNVLYWQQVSRYREHFDNDRIKVLLKADPHSPFRDCGRFLGVDPDGFDFEKAATLKKQTVDKRTDTRLTQRLRQWSSFWILKEVIPESIIQLSGCLAETARSSPIGILMCVGRRRNV